MSFFLLNNLYDKNYRHFCDMYPKNPSQFPSQPHNKKAAKLVEKGDLWQIYTPIPPAIHTVRKQECSLKNIYVTFCVIFELLLYRSDSTFVLYFSIMWAS